MNARTLEKFKKILLSERVRITKSMTKEIEVDFDGDEIDEIQGNLIASLQAQLSARAKGKLSQIELALGKINSKSFGICDDCSEHIPEKRLMFNPYCSTCVDCAEDREIETKRKIK